METKRRKKRSQWQDVFRRFKKNRLAVVGLIMLLVLFVIAILSIFIVDYENVVTQNVSNKLAPWSAEHPLGTDTFGRDILSRLLYASRYSITIGFAVVILSISAGIIIGSVAGYYGGIVDTILMRITDILIAIPVHLFAIAVVAVLGPGIVNLTIAISLANISGYARLMRSAVLGVKEMDYIEAARALGASNFRILWKHIIPATLAPMIVQATLGVGFAIICASALSYLGLGILPPDPEWGAMLAEGQPVISISPNLVLVAGFTIMYVVLAFNLVGDGLREALDPKMKN
jgi:peptide/nickel transport system permease protein